MMARSLFVSCALTCLWASTPIVLAKPASPAPPRPPASSGNSNTGLPTDVGFPMYWAVAGENLNPVNFSGLPIIRDRVAFFYESNFGRYPYIWRNPANGSLDVINGGIPQRADWQAHINEMRRDINQAIPDRNYDGYAIIDFESWIPNWDTSVNEPVKQLSRDHVRERFPFATAAEVERRAEEEYEREGMDFLVRTVQFCKQERPNAKWGYYGYPWGVIYSQLDSFQPLFQAVDVVCPSIYALHFSIPDWQSRGSGQAGVSQYIRGYDEHVKIARRMAGTKPVLAFVWMRYSENNSIYQGQFINDLDLNAMLRVPKRSGADGIVFWDVVNSQRINDYNSFFAGRGGQAMRNFLNELVSPYGVSSPANQLSANPSASTAARTAAAQSAPPAKSSSGVQTTTGRAR